MPLPIAACTPDEEIGSIANAASPTAADVASIGESQTYGVASNACGGAIGDARKLNFSEGLPKASVLKVPSGSLVPHIHESPHRSTTVSSGKSSPCQRVCHAMTRGAVKRRLRREKLARPVASTKNRARGMEMP